MTRKQVLAALACVLMLLCVLVSLSFLAHEAAHPHMCIGEDCAVCRFIASVGRSLRGFGAGLLWLVLSWLALNIKIARPFHGGVPFHALDTPIARMVRMND